MLYWNVWSINNETKLQNFLQIIEDLYIEVACICESWFDSKNGFFSKMIKDAGYELHHAHREDKRAGGVAIMYKKHLSIKEEDASTTQFVSFEYVSIKLTVQHRIKLILVCLYRKQEISFNIFQEELSLFLDRMLLKADSLLFVGDFNVWIDMENDKNADHLRTIMNACGMNQQVAQSTHRCGHTLDHIYFNEFQITVEHQVITDNLGLTTDHFPIVIKLPSNKTNEKKRTTQFRKLNNINMNAFRTDLQNSCDTLMQIEDSNFVTLCTRYHALSSVVDKHAPIKRKTIKNTESSWIDQDYKKCRALRRRYEKLRKRNRTEENRLNYINQKQLCVELALSKRSEDYRNLVRNAGSCQKTLFKIANELLDKTKVKVLPSYNNPKQLADDFNNYFVHKVKKIRNSIPKSSEECIVYTRKFNGERIDNFRLVSEEEVKNMIKEKGIKTFMEDPIPSRLMNSSLDIILPVLTRLINKSLQEGSMEGIKESVLDPLLKKTGLDAEEYKNFRPVNNLLFLSKIIERCVDDQITNHMTKNGLQEASQFAYKKHHNTEMMMLGIVNEALRGFDENQATVIIFLDLSAAFDTIDVNKLLEIMYEELGLGGTVLKWFSSFLKGRTQRVKIEDKYSDKEEVPFGAPQGSILGPRCFNINVRSQRMAFERCKFKSSSFAEFE